ncbi:uncharacterized protein LOC119830679 isoform X2 [Zerene cesonia]|uniref:uncharacterized protein LOC119830679 isoform X2 n=1 Tax=Zerene cesonia TaxID=33412 RepID=UPI0018E57D18|nr:uncharacterized protein LOC119830679 isoform X2 [Zerene cesonia]
MAEFNEVSSSLPDIVSQKVSAVENSFQKTLNSFKDLVLEFERIHIDALSYKSQYLSHKNKCESKCCSSAQTMSKEIENKDGIIQQIASALTCLLETKNLSIVEDIFKLICSDNSNAPLISPKKEILHERSVQDESVSEIEGTPTGRKSPIISSRKMKSNTSNGLSLSKKKCPDTWETPEKKNMKLLFPSPSRTKPGSRMKQSRLNLVKVKSSCVVDLTCSPETLAKAMSCSNVEIKPNIKKELIDNDETILPSPTSGLPVSQIFPPKSLARSSPSKFKKPLTPLKFKIEEETMLEDNCDDEKSSPTYTQCVDGNKHTRPSPKKEPLAENNNLVNTSHDDIESSMSILRSNLQVNKVSPTGDRQVKRPHADGPVYKEPTVRKKSEKRALRGWSCDECRNFYGELYKDNPLMLEQKMDECSKHRGKNNPVRPKTPPGFWDPRWEVPTDTEEFNRRNNAI